MSKKAEQVMQMISIHIYTMYIYKVYMYTLCMTICMSNEYTHTHTG